MQRYVGLNLHVQRLQIHCRMFSLVKLSVRFVAKLHFRMEEGGYYRAYVFESTNIDSWKMTEIRNRLLLNYEAKAEAYFASTALFDG